MDAKLSSFYVSVLQDFNIMVIDVARIWTYGSNLLHKDGIRNRDCKATGSLFEA